MLLAATVLIGMFASKGRIQVDNITDDAWPLVNLFIVLAIQIWAVYATGSLYQQIKVQVVIVPAPSPDVEMIMPQP
jgi:hypothetical protein